MSYQVIYPSPALRPFVEKYILLKTSSVLNHPEQMPPGGRSGLLLNLGDDYEVQCSGITHKPSLASFGGQLTQVMWLTRPANCHFLMITFQPTGIYQLFGLPMAELTDQFPSMEDVLPLSVRQQWFSVVDQLRELKQDKDRIQLVETHLLAQANRSPFVQNTWVDTATGWLTQPGNGRIQKIATELRISPRQLSREFSRQVGISPKSYAQVMRFNTVFRTVLFENLLSWQDLVHVGGWYDQAHFCNDIYRITGLTPSVFFTQHHNTAKVMLESKS